MFWKNKDKSEDPISVKYDNDYSSTNNKPIKILGHRKSDNATIEILLLPSKDGSTWQYVNVTKGYITPCKFNSKEDALADFIKYKDKYYKVEFIEIPTFED